MMTTTSRRCGAFGVFVVLGLVSLLIACETSTPTERVSDEPDAGHTVEAGAPGRDDGPDVDADIDADAGDDFVVPDASVTCAADPCAVAITGHGDSFCVVLQNGKLSCWGSNTSGQLGYTIDDSSFSATPRVLEGLADVKSASVGSTSTCARVGNGDVFCWGDPELVNAGIVPEDGGEGFSEPVMQPTRMNAVPSATNLAVGTGFACALASDGSTSCWGTNAKLELGRGATDSGSVEPPAKASLLGEPVVAVIPGDTRTFAIAPSGALLSWGAGGKYGPDSFGRYKKLVDFLLGRDTSEPVDGVPNVVPSLTRVRAVATSSVHACAIAGRDVHCWGSNELGQLGRGSYSPAPSVFTLPPSFLPEVSNVRFVADAENVNAGIAGKDVALGVAVADSHSCAVMGSGRVYCWGKKGDFGVLGSKPTHDFNGVPTRIEGLSGAAVAIASADSTVCALLRSGAVECWGANSQGQLGTGSPDDLPHPTPSRVVLAN